MALTRQALTDIALGRNGSYGLSRDVLTHNLWDVRIFGTNVTNYTFFSQGIGSQFEDGTKDEQETNLNDSGKLPNGQTFLVKRIGVGLIVPALAAFTNAPDIVQAYTNIMHHTVFDIKIAGREFDFQIHGRQFVPSVFINSDLPTGDNAARVGDFITSGFFSLGPIPIFIDQLVSFSVPSRIGSSNNHTIATALDADFTLLNGLYARQMVTLEGVLTRAK